MAKGLQCSAVHVNSHVARARHVSGKKIGSVCGWTDTQTITGKQHFSAASINFNDIQTSSTTPRLKWNHPRLKWNLLIYIYIYFFFKWVRFCDEHVGAWRGVVSTTYRESTDPMPGRIFAGACSLHPDLFHRSAVWNEIFAVKGGEAILFLKKYTRYEVNKVDETNLVHPG